MNKKNIYLPILICLTIATILCSSGCIEVTPSSDTSNASSFGLNNTGGNLTSSLGERTPTPEDTSQSDLSSQRIPPDSDQNTGGPDVKMPVPPVQRIVPATPMAYEGFPTPVPTILTRTLPPEKVKETIISIYKINQSFKNNAVAFAYDLTKPPLFIDLTFSPVMGKDVIAWEKKTGTKEGDVVVTVYRPLKDAWFELRVYDKANGNVVLKEGYGKNYSHDNKSVVIRTAGSYQFDLIGNEMTAMVNFTISVPENELYLYQDLLNQINTQKEDASKISEVFLLLEDLPPGWEIAGDVIRTDTTYQSLFKKEGVTLRQKIKKYTSSDLAISELEKLKTAAGSDSTGPSLIGQKGFVVDMSQIKTQLVFVQDLYLVELSCFTPPNPIPVSDLQDYGNIIIKRILSSENKG